LKGRVRITIFSIYHRVTYFKKFYVVQVLSLFNLIHFFIENFTLSEVEFKGENNFHDVTSVTCGSHITQP
jgi:hypothetical protein